MKSRRVPPKPGLFPWLAKSKIKGVFILVTTGVHMLLTGLLFYWNYTALIADLDVGNPLSWTGNAILWVSEIFRWPLITLLAQNEFVQKSLPAYSFYVVLTLNSLLWALVALGILLGIRSLSLRRRKQR